MARLLIVSDTKPMAHLLEAVFQSHPRVEIIGRVWTVEEAVRVAAELTPDIVVVSSGVVLREDGVALADQVYRANPHAVVVVTATTLPGRVRQELLDVCAIPLEQDIMEVPHALEELIPDLREPVAAQAT
jgi:chemotaxis response regulator CheB